MVEWKFIVIGTAVYWAALFIAWRIQGRREIDRAFERAMAAPRTPATVMPDGSKRLDGIMVEVPLVLNLPKLATWLFLPPLLAVAARLMIGA